MVIINALNTLNCSQDGRQAVDEANKNHSEKDTEVSNAGQIYKKRGK